MYNSKILDGISNIDGDIIEKYWRYKQVCREKRKRKTKWLLSTIAACLILSICIPTIIIYTPVVYDLDYDSPNGWNIAYGIKNAWIYYAEGSEIKRERVRLPLYDYGLFVAWRHLNGIGEEVNFKLSRVSDAEDDIYLSEENTIYYYPFENQSEEGKVYVITLSKEIEDYFDEKDPNTLMKSLILTISKYRHGNFNIIIK